MKKHVAVMIVALATLMSFPAQAKIPHFEVVAGLNAANVSMDGTHSRIGGHAGIRTSIGIPNADDGFYANIGALLSLKGFEANRYMWNPFYLDIPVHFGYKHAVTEALAFFGELGPYFGVGLFGKSEGRDIFRDCGFKRFDAGFGISYGLEFYKTVPVSIGYDIGVIDIGNAIPAKNRNITLSVGYKF